MLKLAVFFGLLAASGALPTERIVNGTDAKIGEIPYIVSLRYNQKHSCGGSILNEYHILTACHCVFGEDADDYTIQYGVLRISADKTNSIQVKSIRIHENYEPGVGWFNDIAVLKLESPIPFSQTVRPITLPRQNAPTLPWSKAVLAGWGLSATGGIPMIHLQRVDILIFPDDDCEAAHDGETNRKYHICAGVPEGGKGQCNGDSGGPLTVNGFQIGVVSWSVKPCTVEGYPGVFARVAQNIDWIRRNSQIYDK